MELEEKGERAALGGLEEARAFLLAGLAVCTLQNDESGVRYTYRVTLPRKQRQLATAKLKLYYVDLLTGPNNQADYTALGYLLAPVELECRPGAVDYRHFNGMSASGKLSKIPEDAPSVRGFVWLVRQLWHKPGLEDLPAPMSLWHEASCGRCGRALTDPESIRCGLGPVCREKSA